MALSVSANRDSCANRGGKMTEAYSPVGGLTRRNFLKSTGVAAAAVAAGGAGAFAAGGLAQAATY